MGDITTRDTMLLSCLNCIIYLLARSDYFTVDLSLVNYGIESNDVLLLYKAVGSGLLNLYTAIFWSLKNNGEEISLFTLSSSTGGVIDDRLSDEVNWCYESFPKGNRCLNNSFSSSPVPYCSPISSWV